MKKKIYVINGPSLNLLGRREPEIYGYQTYSDLDKMLYEYAENKGFEIVVLQSNCEGKIVTFIQDALDNSVDGILINPAAYTHTSIAIRDALLAVNLPTVEVHISDVNNREDFRKIDYIKDICVGYVSGEGLVGYLHGLDILLTKIGA